MIFQNTGQVNCHISHEFHICIRTCFLFTKKKKIPVFFCKGTSYNITGQVENFFLK